MTRWEYRTVRVIHDWDTDYRGGWEDQKSDLSEWLDACGQDGWELVTIWPTSTAQGMEYWAVFKRPLDEPQGLMVMSDEEREAAGYPPRLPDPPEGEPAGRVK